MVETLPLFPLGTVLLPGASLPLHIFEPRYRQLTVDLASGKVPGKTFGVVAVRPGWNSRTKDIEEVHSIGCSAELQKVDQLQDGRFEIDTTGARRFRILELDCESAPYLVAEVEWLPDNELTEAVRAQLPELAIAARAAHWRYRNAAPGLRRLASHVGSPHGDEPIRDEALANLIACTCLLDLPDLQLLLEQRCPGKRLKLISRLLHQEAGFIEYLRAVPMPLAELGHRTSAN
ncbi:MAG: LON peptidase substrate-binding domain-containing protein [Sciscionella sp.]